VPHLGVGAVNLPGLVGGVSDLQNVHARIDGGHFDWIFLFLPNDFDSRSLSGFWERNYFVFVLEILTKIEPPPFSATAQMPERSSKAEGKDFNRRI
jgi:hypothetical protein